MMLKHKILILKRIQVIDASSAFKPSARPRSTPPPVAPSLALVGNVFITPFLRLYLTPPFFCLFNTPSLPLAHFDTTLLLISIVKFFLLDELQGQMRDLFQQSNSTVFSGRPSMAPSSFLKVNKDIRLFGSLTDQVVH